MRYLKIFLMFGGIFITICTFVAASDLKLGMHSMRWGSSISQHSHLVKVREADNVAYYVNSNTLYQVANQPVPGVVYGFYKDRFFAVYIKFSTPNQFASTVSHFHNKYGKPKTTANRANQHSIYRWKRDDIKVKLKMKEAIGEYKMAVYYAPLSTRLNEEQTEKETPDAPETGGSKHLNVAPLLN